MLNYCHLILKVLGIGHSPLLYFDFVEGHQPDRVLQRSWFRHSVFDRMQQMFDFITERHCASHVDWSSTMVVILRYVTLVWRRKHTVPEPNPYMVFYQSITCHFSTPLDKSPKRLQATTPSANMFTLM